MIDTKQSFRKGSVIVEVHVNETICQHCEQKETHLDTCIMNLVHGGVVPVEITKVPTDFGSINKAKKANRVTKYRTVPVRK